MLAIGVGQAEGLETIATTREALTQARGNLAGKEPSAMLVFASAEFDVDVLLAELGAACPGVPLLGCTTVGEISSGMGFSELSVAIMLLASDSHVFGVGAATHASEDPQVAVAEALDEARHALDGEEEALCIVLLNGLSGVLAETVEALEDALSEDCAFFGGASARHGTLRPKKPALFADRRHLHDGVALMLFSGPVAWSFCVNNSWRPIGEKRRVTASEGRKLLRIGERRALDYYQHYLGKHLTPASEFPLAVYEDDEAHFLLRGPVAYDQEEGSVSFGAPIPTGRAVQLSEVVRSEILARTREDVARTAQDFVQERPAGALMFSCVLRKTILGSKAQEELAVVQQELPDVPIAGFYGFGEIGPLVHQGPGRLHNTTLVMLLLGAGEAADTPAHEALPPTPHRESSEFLEWKLARSEYYRRDLEQVQEAHSTLMRNIHQEIEEARAELARLNAALEKEKARTEQLLLNILPAEVAHELKEHGHVDPVHVESVSVLFTDFVGFTRIANKMTPKELVAELDFFFSEMDKIMARHNLYKLKTIGDAYMAAGGIPIPNETHSLDAVRAAWEICEFVTGVQREREARNETSWKVRIGVHTGPLMAGVIGQQRFAYDVWGDTVNTASRLESNGEAGRVNVSRVVADAVKHEFEIEARGAIAAKNLGPVEMFWISKRKP